MPGSDGLTHELALALVSQAPDAVIFVDTDGFIRIWNEAARRVFGYSQEEVVGKNIDIIIPERFRKPHHKGFDRVVEDRETKYAGKVLVTRSARSDGTRIYVEMSIAVVLDAGGHILGILSQVRDITERFEKEKRASNSLTGRSA